MSIYLSLRLSSLGYASRAESLLPRAVGILAAAVPRACPWFREASQGLLRTCLPPLRHSLACWVGLSRCTGSPTASHFTDSWSYLLNLTIIGNAIYMSMDIPDAFLAVRSSLAL